MMGPTSRPGKRTATRALIALLLPALAFGLLSTPGGATRSNRASYVNQAKKGLLILSDLPKGWSSSKGSTGGGNFRGEKQLANCIGSPASAGYENPPSAARDFYSPGHSLSVNDEVDYHSSSKEARISFDSFSSSKTPGCLTTLLNGVDKSILTAGGSPNTKIGPS
jgi:hypothetical protein